MDCRYEVVIEEGLDRGRHLPLSNATLTIGRGEVTEVHAHRVFLADPTVSRVQATMRWDSLLQAFVLTHSPDASNVTRVNDKPVLSQTLEPNDEIRFGHVLLRFGRTVPLREMPPDPPDTVQIHGLEGMDLETDFTAAWTVNAGWHLAFTSAANRGRNLVLGASSLVQGRTITMGGRGGRNNEIPFLEPCIPNQAARLEFLEASFWIVNEEAGELLRVNDRPVLRRTLLRSGDVVRLSETVFVLQEGPPTGDPVCDATTWVEVISGVDGDVGHRYSLGPERARIGREATCHLVVRDTSVSRHHVSIILRGGDYVLEHSSRRNPTLVNGVQVDHERVLAHGDEIQISEHTILRLVVRAMEVFV